jgi:hypothetical protein
MAPSHDQHRALRLLADRLDSVLDGEPVLLTSANRRDHRERIGRCRGGLSARLKVP